MSIRSLIVGDLHLNDNPRDKYRHDFQSYLRDIVYESKPDRLIFVGDFTDAKDRHSAWLVNKIVNYFALLAELVDEIIALQGNHDYLDEEWPFFEFLSHIEGIRWIRRPRLIDDWLFLPHTRDYEADWKGVDLKRPRLIITHNTFAGADNGFGKRLRGIPLEVIPKGAQVISGDVHVPQELGPVSYIGAPYTINFGDDFHPQLFLIEGEKLTPIPCDGPQKILVEVEAGKKLDPHSTLNSVRAGDILKVRVHIDADKVDQWPKLRSDIRSWADKYDITISIIQPIVKYRGSKQVKGGAIKKRSDKELILAYGKNRSVDPGTLKTGTLIAERS
jgi:predicted phosphodiesterase